MITTLANNMGTQITQLNMELAKVTDEKNQLEIRNAELQKIVDKYRKEKAHESSANNSNNRQEHSSN